MYKLDANIYILVSSLSISSNFSKSPAMGHIMYKWIAAESEL